ncbi:SCO family protein [Microbulbifer guangxiensis]|uniref:SCO family protein n=1 Tax=Microbulbifer guangxiensis TaxID=2904249 RepID=UPI001F23CA97|nr:hypothetical protein [Microbulbifer guangxiensis]
MSQQSLAATAAGGEGRERKSALGRLQGISLIAAVALPIVAAYVVYHTGLGMPDGTINQGELIQPPVDVGSITLDERTDTGESLSFSLDTAPPRWRYLILPDGRCESSCENLLYTSRQVHIRLGEKSDRVERLLLTPEPLPEERWAAIVAQHPRLRFVTADASTLQTLRRNSGLVMADGPQALLVDQEGFAMMRYGNEHTGNQILKDIKRLLKYSYEQ